MKPAGNRQSLIRKIVMGLAVLLQALLVFYMQRRFAFLRLDIDYMVNLKTGEPLSGLGDIFAGVGSVLSGKGGSTLSIGVLQFTLLLGEVFADILNTLVLLGISFLISRAVEAKTSDVFSFAMPFFLLFALNDDWHISYMWQFGVVNFVYPAIPFLIYLGFVMKEVNLNGRKLPRAIEGVGVVCAFLCSWANGSYGAIAFLIALFAMILVSKIVKRRIPFWLLFSALAAFAGSILYIAAPGNFSSEAIMNGVYISFSIFPGVVLALLLLAILLRCGGWLTVGQILLITVLGGSVIWRFIVGWVPGMYENGSQICSLILSITLFCSLLLSIRNTFPKHRFWGYMLAGCSFVYAMLTILENFGGVG